MSGWEDDTLNDVYDKTGGYCHICGKTGLHQLRYARRKG